MRSTSVSPASMVDTGVAIGKTGRRDRAGRGHVVEAGAGTGWRRLFQGRRDRGQRRPLELGCGNRRRGKVRRCPILPDSKRRHREMPARARNRPRRDRTTRLRSRDGRNRRRSAIFFPAATPRRWPCFKGSRRARRRDRRTALGRAGGGQDPSPSVRPLRRSRRAAGPRRFCRGPPGRAGSDASPTSSRGKTLSRSTTSIVRNPTPRARLFTLFNGLREHGRHLIVASRMPLSTLVACAKTCVRDWDGPGLRSDAASPTRTSLPRWRPMPRGRGFRAGRRRRPVPVGARSAATWRRSSTCLRRSTDTRCPPKRPITVPLLRGWFQRDIDPRILRTARFSLTWGRCQPAHHWGAFNGGDPSTMGP
jgi:hypothetical protein